MPQPSFIFRDAGASMAVGQLRCHLHRLAGAAPRNAFLPLSQVTDVMSKQTAVAILGAAGRMGRTLIQALPAQPDLRLGAAFEHTGNAALGEEIAPGIVLGSDMAAAAAAFDVLVDFTRPPATIAALESCVALGKGMVIGTTGFDDAQNARIREASQTIPICLSGNFSIGVNLCLSLVEQAAQVLGRSFDIEVVEAHHRHKVDAPSGTALMLGGAAARGAGLSLDQQAVYARQGHTGARRDGSIGFSTIRGGDVVGDHTVLFLGEGERVEITHKASSRLNFANGALRAAAWLSEREPGLYGMNNVLGSTS